MCMSPAHTLYQCHIGLFIPIRMYQTHTFGLHAVLYHNMYQLRQTERTVDDKKASPRFQYFGGIADYIRQAARQFMSGNCFVVSLINQTVSACQIWRIACINVKGSCYKD